MGNLNGDLNKDLYNHNIYIYSTLTVGKDPIKIFRNFIIWIIINSIIVIIIIIIWN